MALPLLAVGSFLKSQWKSISIVIIILTLVVTGVTSITSTIKENYTNGYNAGYNQSSLEYSKQQIDLLYKYSELKTSIENFSEQASNEAIRTKSILEKRTTLILNKLDNNLTNEDCSPSQEFIGAWNELSKSTASNPTP